MNHGSPPSALAIVALAALLPLLLGAGGPTDRRRDPRPAAADRAVDLTTERSLVAMNLNTDGYQGNFFASPSSPSLAYPRNSHVEHLFQAGLWVGARTASGEVRVSTSAEDANGHQAALELREFAWDQGPVEVWSADIHDPLYDPRAVASWEAHYAFRDDAAVTDHVPLGLRVLASVLAWDAGALDDGVVIEYAVINQSGTALRDLHVGYFADATVGNTDVTDPYDPNAPVSWNYYDDLSGAWRPGDVPADPTGWLMHKHDGDGEDGMATSWVGCRLLSLEPAAVPGPGQPPVSYNAWPYHHVPRHDDTYIDDDGLAQPGKYQLMSNGDFDVGVTDEGDFTIMHDWMGLLSTGPVPLLAAGDTLRVAFAVVCGVDSTALQDNAAAMARHHAGGYQPVAVLPSAVPPMAELAPPYPNPFNPGTVLKYSLAAGRSVRLSIHAVDGSLVRVLVDGHRSAGEHAAVWDGRDAGGRGVASGPYLVRLMAGTTCQTRGLTLLK